MDCRELIERLAAEIERASADNDGVRARKLADLQLDVLAGMSREAAAEPPGGPSPGVPLTPQEQTELLGERRIAALSSGLGQPGGRDDAARTAGLQLRLALQDLFRHVADGPAVGECPSSQQCRGVVGAIAALY
jgi:hypothetical protein